MTCHSFANFCLIPKSLILSAVLFVFVVLILNNILKTCFDKNKFFF